MRGRAALLAALLLVAPTSTAVGATAQSRDVEPAGFAGSLHEPAADSCDHDATYEVVDGLSQTRGYCVEQWMGTSEPRFTGTYTRLVDVDEYRDAESLYSRRMVTETIYIALLDEGTPAWRPAEAEALGHGKYRVLPPDHYDPEDEVWEFIPGTVVRCAKRSLGDGDHLVAYERVE